jgi:hypothetical protein
MKRHIQILSSILLLTFSVQAQYIYRMRPVPRYRPAPKHQNLPKFDPEVYLKIGYGFPNLDKNDLLWFDNYYIGTINQNGPVSASVDYRFKKSSSVGLMVTYGKLNAPYYSFNGNASDPPSFYGHLESWSVMLNLVRYIPLATDRIEPYLRTAFGVNIWQQNYQDASGNKVVNADDPNPFAYQASIGSNIKLSKSSALYVEAGYGKYILSGGLSFKL